jgi:hypothetical protein|nr:MAG TPA: hypothetical protein [Caudoviricetes sp.]
MKDHQFEEIVFWLSLIACLLAYHSGIGWLVGIIAVISVMNCISAIVTAWKYARSELKKKYLIVRTIKRWFCRHRWEFIRKDSVCSMDESHWYKVSTYQCIKCGKIKVVRPNKTKSKSGYADR